MKKFRSSTSILLYLGNDTIYGDSNYGTPRGSHYAIYRMVPFSMTLNNT